MPKGAKILDVQKQGDCIVLWALVYPDAEVETRKFQLYATGNLVDLNENLIYLKTLQVEEENFVLHIFEATYEKAY